MPACCVVGCNNRSSRKTSKQLEKEKKYPAITFHKFPKNLERRAAWVKAVRTVRTIDWKPKFSSVICSEHFTEDYFDRTSLSCVRLREIAVPNILSSSIKKSKKILQNFENKNTSDNGTPIPEPKIKTILKDAKNRDVAFIEIKSITSVNTPNVTVAPNTNTTATLTSVPHIKTVSKNSEDINVARIEIKSMPSLLNTPNISVPNNISNTNTTPTLSPASVTKTNLDNSIIKILPVSSVNVSSPSSSEASSTNAIEASISSQTKKPSEKPILPHESIPPHQTIHKQDPFAVIILRRQLQEQKIEHRKKVRLLQQTNRRQTKKISNLLNVLKNLRDQNLQLEREIVDLKKAEHRKSTRQKRPVIEHSYVRNQ